MFGDALLPAWIKGETVWETFPPLKKFIRGSCLGDALLPARIKGGNGVGDVSPAIFLNCISGGKTGRPSPLKIISAEPARHVHDFADKKQSRNFF